MPPYIRPRHRFCQSHLLRFSLISLLSFAFAGCQFGRPPIEIQNPLTNTRYVSMTIDNQDHLPQELLIRYSDTSENSRVFYGNQAGLLISPQNDFVIFAYSPYYSPGINLNIHTLDPVTLQDRVSWHVTPMAYRNCNDINIWHPAFAISPAGDQLAVYYWAHIRDQHGTNRSIDMVSLWDPSTGNFITEMELPLREENRTYIQRAKRLSFSPDGQYIALYGTYYVPIFSWWHDPYIQRPVASLLVWRIDTGEPVFLSDNVYWPNRLDFMTHRKDAYNLTWIEQSNQYAIQIGPGPAININAPINPIQNN